MIQTPCEILSRKRLFSGRFFFVLLALLPALSFAGERSVFQGTLEGVGTVVMELEASTQESDEAVAKEFGTELDIPFEARNVFVGRYFYARHGVDIPLFGTLGRMTEPLPSTERYSKDTGKRSDSPKAYWEGRIVQGHFRGQWRDAATNRVRRFDLTRVARYDPEKTRPDAIQAVSEAIAGGMGSGLAYDVEINPQQTPYEYLKLQGYAVPVGEIIPGQTDTVAWQAHRDPRSKFDYPRLVRHPNPDILKRVNALLEQRHWQMTLAALACASSIHNGDGIGIGGDDMGGYEVETIQVDFLSETLMSVSETGSPFCGGAHPNNHYDPFTLDLIRGEYLDWNRLFRASTRGKYGWESSPEMTALIEEIPQDAQDDVCNSEIVQDYLTFHFDKAGYLALAVSGIGHAGSVCLGVQAEIPFSDLGAIRKPEAQRYFPEWKGK